MYLCGQLYYTFERSFQPYMYMYMYMKNNEILMDVFYRPISRDKGGVYL